MKHIDCAQYSPEWWTARRGIPTASNAHRIITPSKGALAAGHRSYLAELIGDEMNPDYPQVDDRASAAMIRGTRMEPEARSLYELWAGETVRECGLCLTDCGRFGCSPDGLVGDDGCVEFKCPSPGVFAGYVLDGVLPAEYLPQCHMHLLVTGRAWVDFVAYYPGQSPFIVRAEPDSFTEKLRACLTAFDTAYQAARRQFNLSYATGPLLIERLARISQQTLRGGNDPDDPGNVADAVGELIEALTDTLMQIDVTR